MPRLSLFGGNILTGIGLGTLSFGAGDERLFDQPGTYTWVAPIGVTSVSAVVVGGGGHGGQNTVGGGGGALAYRNKIPVIPG
jgi:hypothetical protein